MSGHHGGGGSVEVRRTGRVIIVTFLLATGIAAAAGVVWLWPASAHPAGASGQDSFAAPGVTFPSARVTSVQPACPASDGVEGAADAAPAGTTAADGAASATTSGGTSCGTVTAAVSDRQDAATVVTVAVAPEVTRSGLQAGDQITLMRVPAGAGTPATFAYFTTQRNPALLWFFVAFGLLVVVVARLRGLMALVMLGFSAAAVGRFLLPALSEGRSPILVALVACAALIFVVLYATHGPSWRTTCAVAGTLVGLGLMAGIGEVAVRVCRLTGVADEGGATLASASSDIGLQGLLTCGIIVAGLGVLNDVTVTQASAVWELRAAAPDASRRRVFLGAMRVGRDHIASTIYTIVFAYTGTAMVVLMLLSAYDRSWLGLLSSEELSEEVVRTLTSASALVLAVPITTLIASLVAAPREADRMGAGTADWEEELRRPDETFDDFWTGTRRPKRPRRQGAAA